jgi:hypothetical protein
MKNLILFVIIFAVGAFSYPFLNNLLEKVTNTSKESQNIQISPASITQTATQSPATSGVGAEDTTTTEQALVVTTDGSVLEGPFHILNAQGEDTEGTVKIIRSPEEILLQFENFQQPYPHSAQIYFSDDLEVDDYLNLGLAKMKEKVFIYGVPQDADLGKYGYILIYDPIAETVVYSAKIQ